MKRDTRITYVQFFVLALVLGIVGRMVAPRFSGASEEDRVSVLVDGLTDVRAHLDLYKVCNDNNCPPTNSSASFERALVTRSESYEPLIESVPVNPFNGLNTVRFDGEPAGADKAGWRFDSETGRFQSDHDGSYSGL